MKNYIEKFSFFGLPVSDISDISLYDFFKDAITSAKGKIIYGYSLYSIYALRKIPEIYSLGCKSDLFLTDGRPFYWLCKLIGIPVSPGISIPECVMSVLDFADSNQLSVIMVGGTEEINIKAQNNLRNKYKGLQMINGFHGYFNNIEEKKIIEYINSSKPDLLLVGMSSPKKERFVINNSLNAKIIIPCGGMIDVLAGKIKMTPRWFKRRGLATLFRVAQEPRRLLIDRCKMAYFLFAQFFPLLLFKIVFKYNDFSIPDHYLGKSKRIK